MLCSPLPQKRHVHPRLTVACICRQTTPLTSITSILYEGPCSISAAAGSYSDWSTTARCGLGILFESLSRVKMSDFFLVSISYQATAWSCTSVFTDTCLHTRTSRISHDNSYISRRDLHSLCVLKHGLLWLAYFRTETTKRTCSLVMTGLSNTPTSGPPKMRGVCTLKHSWPVGLYST